MGESSTLGGAAGGAGAPVVRYRLASADPDEAVEHMRAAYTQFDARSARAEGFEFSIDGVVAGPAEITALRYSLPGRANAEPSGRLVAVVASPDTRMQLTNGRENVRGTVALTPPSSPYTTEWQDVRAAIVALDHAEIDRLARERHGLGSGAVTFHAMAPRSELLGRYWAGLITHLRRDLIAHDALLAEPLLRTSVMRQLALAALAVFPNTTHTLGPPKDGEAAEPATVRRAVEYMEAHAHEPISVAEIAAAARVRARGLQHAFARHRGTSPLAYLRQVRLHRAHADLVAADPARGDTVAAVAARWGYANPGRFAAEYREQFGALPSTTLRR